MRALGQAGEFHAHLVTPRAAANHPRAIRVGRRLERDGLILESLAADDDVRGIRALPGAPVDFDGRAIQVDGAEEGGLGSRRTRGGAPGRGRRHGRRHFLSDPIL